MRRLKSLSSSLSGPSAALLILFVLLLLPPLATAQSRIWGWEDNRFGQLGDSMSSDQSVPIPVLGLPPVQAVACGNVHSLVLTSDGTVWAWGSNVWGQLGNGQGQDNTKIATPPAQITGLSGVMAIAAGRTHSLALKTEGTVWAWGNGGFGQLGNGAITGSTTPSQVVGPGGTGFLTGISAVAGGGNYSLALKADGTVWAWGYNINGQLGDGTTTQRTTPVQVSGLTNVIAIAAGYGHSLALKSDGTVWAWGDNINGQLGDGTNTQRNTPVQVSGLSGITALAARGTHSLALKSDGTVWSWGHYGKTPVQIGGLSGITAIAAGGNYNGYDYNLALKSDGTVLSWGDNTFGQLGDGTNTQRTAPVQMSGLVGMSGQMTHPPIACGGGHSLVLMNDGTVWACGDNFYGQLGTDKGTFHLSPLPDFSLRNLSNQTTSSPIACGGNHNLALMQDHTVWAWGDNAFGQLGDGTSGNLHTVPVQVSTLTEVAAVSAGRIHSLALKLDGTVWAWGDNSSGQLGNGAIFGNHYLPIQVVGPGGTGFLTGIRAVAGGGNYNLALKSDGTVWAWGDNQFGELGDGTRTERHTPVQVSGLTNVIAIAAGEQLAHSLALKADGTIWAWGQNEYGQLGDGTNTNSNVPVQVHGLNSIIAIASGNTQFGAEVRRHRLDLGRKRKLQQ